MLLEHSYGVVPLKRKDGVWKVFLIQHKNGHWSLPKGRPEGEEGPLKTAERELEEETGLYVEHWLTKYPLFEHYRFSRAGHVVDKTVSYYPAVVDGKEALQLDEVQSGAWLELAEAVDRATFSEVKEVIAGTKRLMDDFEERAGQKA